MPSWITWLRSISLVSAVIGSSGSGQVGQSGPNGTSVVSQIGLEHHECDLAGRGLLIVAVEGVIGRPPAATSALVRREWRPARGRGPCCGRRTDTSTSGFAIRFPSHAGGLSSPPREATTTWVEPICSGEVSSTVRGLPLLRPTVVNSTTGIFIAVQPSLPMLNHCAARWTAFIAFRVRSLGTPRP